MGRSHSVSTLEHCTNIFFSWSWLLGRRPEYTDPKVVAHGEGREGLVLHCFISQTTSLCLLKSHPLHLCMLQWPAFAPKDLSLFLFTSWPKIWRSWATMWDRRALGRHQGSLWSDSSSGWKWDWWALILTSIMLTVYTWGWKRLLQFQSDSRKEVSHPQQVPGCRNKFCLLCLPFTFTVLILL